MVPSIPDLAEVLARRRRILSRFRKGAEQLRQDIASCAAGEMDNTAFYERLRA